MMQPSPPLALANWFKRQPTNIQGALWLFCALASFSVAFALVKQVGQHMHVTQIVALRQVIVLAALIPALLKSSKADLTLKRPSLQLIRASFAFCAILTGFTAVIHLPLATSATLGFTRTLFVTIFAVLLLKEGVGKRRIGAMLVGFGGVLIIIRPDTDHPLEWTMILAVFAAACVAMNTILIRIQSQHDKPTTMIAYQGTFIALLMIAPALYWWTPPSFDDLKLIALIGLLTVFAQWALVHAYKQGEASALAPMDYLRLIFATFLGWLFFDNLPDLHTIAGAAVILGSTLYIIQRELKLKRKKAKPAYSER